MTEDGYAIPIYLGVSSDNTHVQADLVDLGHLLVTGDDKTSISRFLAMLRIPWRRELKDALRLLRIDPDLLDAEDMVIIDRPRSRNLHVSTSWKEAYRDLQEICREMESRSGKGQRKKGRGLYIFNRQVDKNGKITRPPQKLIIITELESLMADKSHYRFGPLIQRILQEGSDRGVHVIAATANPENLTKSMKSYFPARVALRVDHANKGRAILDPIGAENLDSDQILFLEPGASDPVKLKNPYLIDPGHPDSISDARNEGDLLEVAVEVIRLAKRASLSTLQRKLQIRYSYAVALMSRLEEQGFVGPATDDGPREILFDL